MTKQMKHSGVEWIGEVPDKWELKRLKYILKERKLKNDPIITKEILSLSVERGVFPYSEKTGGGNKAKEDLTAYKVAYPEDIVINSMNILAGAVGLSKYMGAISPVYYSLYTDSDEIDIKYYYYLFQTEAFQRSLLGLGNGIMMKESDNGKLNTIRMRIPMEKLASLLMPLPPIKTQEKIVQFIEWKVEAINRIISETKQSIEDLKKYKESLITEVITKGLYENIEMKAIGMENPIKIPVNWKIDKVRNLFRMNKGLSITKENLQNEGIPVISYGEIHSKYGFKFDPIKQSVKNVAESYLNTDSAALLQQGDFIFADTSEDIEGSGNFTCYVGNQTCFAGYHTIILKPVKKINFNFLAYLFESKPFRSQIQEKVQGIKVYSITQRILKPLIIWFPSEEEQKLIVEFLDEKISGINSLMSKKQQVIQELEQYKKSLIYEYVTGKKQV